MVTTCCPHAYVLFMVTVCCPSAYIHFVPGDKAARLPSWCQDGGCVELHLTVPYSFTVFCLNQTIYLLYTLVVLGNEKRDNSSRGNRFGTPHTAHVVCFYSHVYSLYILVHVTSHDDGLLSYIRAIPWAFFHAWSKPIVSCIWPVAAIWC